MSKKADELFNSFLDRTPREPTFDVPEKEPSMLQSIGEGASDLARGAAQGATLGFADELTAGALAGKDYLQELIQSGKADNFLQKYRSRKDIEDQLLKQAEERSPILSTVGEVGGSLLAGAALAPVSLTANLGRTAFKEALKTGGKAALGKEIVKRLATGGVDAALTGAITGLGQSEGKIEENPQQIAEDMKSGAITGAVVGPILNTVIPAPYSKEFEKTVINPSKQQAGPLMRQVKRAYQEGKEGNLLFGEPAHKAVAEKELSTTKELTEKLFQGRERLGNEIGNILDDAGEQGIKIGLADDAINSAEFDAIDTLVNKGFRRQLPLSAKENGPIMGDLIRFMHGDLDPRSAHELSKTLKEIRPSIKDNIELNNLIGDAIDAIDSKLGSIPGLEGAKGAFKRYSEATTDRILSGNAPKSFLNTQGQEISNLVNTGGVNDARGKIADKIQQLILKSQKPGASKKEYFDTLNLLEKELGDLSKSNPEVLEKAGLSDWKGFINKLKDTADLSAVSQYIRGYDPSVESVNTLKGILNPTANIYRGANLAGKAAGYVEKHLFNAPKEVLANLTTTLEREGFKDYAQGLQNALQTADQNKQNAILFSLMQNPNIRNSLPAWLGINNEEEK